MSYNGWIDPLTDLTILSVQNSMTGCESSTSCLCDSGLAALAGCFSPNGHYSSIYVTAGILKKIRCSGADLCCPDLHLLLWPQALNQPLHPIHNSGRRSWRKGQRTHSQCRTMGHEKGQRWPGQPRLFVGAWAIGTANTKGTNAAIHWVEPENGRKTHNGL